MIIDEKNIGDYTIPTLDCSKVKWLFFKVDLDIYVDFDDYINKLIRENKNKIDDFRISRKITLLQNEDYLRAIIRQINESPFKYIVLGPLPYAFDLDINEVLNRLIINKNKTIIQISTPCNYNEILHKNQKVINLSRAQYIKEKNIIVNKNASVD